MKYKGIIFDFNGVLFWDTFLQEKAWNVMHQSLRGKPFTKEEMAVHMHGVENRLIFPYILRRKVSEKEFKHLEEKKESIYQKMCLHNKSQLILSPGAIKLLNYLSDKNIPHTIATASSKENVNFFVRHLHLDKWFDVSKIVYPDGTFPGKPFPDTYIVAAKKINLTPKDCIVIEDAISGIKSAYDAGIGYIIGLDSGEKKQKLQPLPGVKEVISSLNEVNKSLFDS